MVRCQGGVRTSQIHSVSSLRERSTQFSSLMRPLLLRGFLDSIKLTGELICRMVHLGSSGSLGVLWSSICCVGGVQINGLVHQVMKENQVYSTLGLVENKIQIPKGIFSTPYG